VGCLAESLADFILGDKGQAIFECHGFEPVVAGDQ
jgi:ABC-type molybdate transport system substrate-binding protein